MTLAAPVTDLDRRFSSPGARALPGKEAVRKIHRPSDGGGRALQPDALSLPGPKGGAQALTTATDSTAERRPRC